jgi:transposase
MPKYKNPQWLRRRYERDGWSVERLAEECDCCVMTIYNWLQEFEIERRGNHPDAAWKDESWLREKYVDEGKSLREVAEMADCSSRTVKEWLDEFGIPTRPTAEPTGPHADREWLKEHYWEQGMTRAQLAEEAGVSINTIAYWLERQDLRRSDRGRSRPLLAE